ncbi:NUDIX domain-containing protein [Neogemmobacter tilapiae]|uniref:ADP-ribose pyrophosphatase n=1 Tax=Neogemmobacter tilapiae TaxID=875041 RepID=A0A918TUK7_9RHOB|nr:NUDIX domain-containing protein [Gemmobacter tilapiae]GHC62033.1 tellurite resistance protein [Gemmobacter tilapiae]
MTDSLHLLAGGLIDPALLRLVLGADVAGQSLLLDGFVARMRPDAPTTTLCPQTDSRAEVLALRLPPDLAARLVFYAESLGLTGAMLDLPLGPAQIHQLGAADLPFDATHWAERWQAIALALAGDIMAAYGTTQAITLARRQGPMLVRAAGRVRAAQPSALTRRHRAAPDDVQVTHRQTPYSAFFAVEEYDLAWRQFDGRFGQPANRAVFLSGDAVTVLPYDPIRDRVLLIDQFRAGPFARGDAQPWLLEAIAGRIDPGETPEQAARREAVEEAGLELTALLPVAGYYPTPGANSEFLYSYVALTDLPDDKSGIFGLEAEAEDIRTHILPFAELMEMVASGEASNAPLILTALWLQRERPHLRPGKS